MTTQSAAVVGKLPKSAKRPQPKGGSRKGRPNKATAELKEMILQALDKAGGVEYLLRQSENNATAFMALIGKVLPMTLQGPNGQAMKFELTLPWLTQAIAQRNG
jgi:hypothetical protein